MKISARNKLQGTITSIEKGAVNSTVPIDGGGGAVITSMITNEAVTGFGLADGKTAYAIVDASDVMVAAE